MKSLFLACCLGLLCPWFWINGLSAADYLPAFSGAEGFGAITPGGRGGKVVHVTNLNDAGPGSFREAVNVSGPRTVVFDVSGIIRLESELSVTEPFLTIAGHTAPGQGVIIANETVSLDTHDIIIRYMRFRRGATDYDRRDDALGSDATPGNIIIDHVSTSWGLDENISLYRNKQNPALREGGSTVLPARNLTIQWTISSEALNPNDHAFGSTVGGAGANFHHNLWASNTGRNPSLSFSFFLDFRNNVHFNWQHRSMDGAGPEAHVNVINSYYKPGPATERDVRYRIVEPEIRDGVREGGVGEWYVNGNHVVGSPTISADNWAGGVQFEQHFPEEWARVDAPHVRVVPPDDPDDPHDDDGTGEIFGTGNPLPIELPVIATQSAEEAYATVLERSGATLPVRDAVDKRVIETVASGNATAGPAENGIINHPDEVGGYPDIPELTRAANWDSDRDCIPDAWETAHGLNSADPEDRNADFDRDGYTNLEEYLHELGAFAAVETIVWQGSINNRYAEIRNWSISFQPSRLDTVLIDSGRTVVDAIGQHAGHLRVAPAEGQTAAIDVTSGWLAVAEDLEIAEGGLLEVGGDARLSVGGSLVNHGTVRLSGDADLAVDGTFINEGVLDISQWQGTLPEEWVNRGIVLRAGTVALRSVNLNGEGLELNIHAEPGHHYQLQSRTDPATGSWDNLGASIFTENGVFSVVQPLAGMEIPRFFRVIQVAGSD